MKTSPIDPGIIATGAEDSSIRIWQLHPNVAHQPCVAVLGGEGGHESGLTQVVGSPQSNRNSTNTKK